MAMLHSRRRLLGCGLPALAALWSGAAIARERRPGGADGPGPLRLSGAGEATRLRLALPPGQPWQLTALADPPRLVLDLPGMAWSGPATVEGAGLVRRARFDAARGRLLLELARPVAPPLVRAAGRGRAGGALAVELLPGRGAAFAALATPGRVLASSAPATPAVARVAPPERPGTGSPPGGTLPLVVLDPGHGGRDPGAIGRSGTYEKRITLAAAQALARQLQATGRCRVALTRTRDVFVPLEDRTAFARARQATLFVSLHADSAPAVARGASVYTLGDTASDGLAAALARRENRADQAGGMRLPSVPPEVARILASLVRQETRAGSERLARMAVGELGREVSLLPNSHRHANFVVLKAPDTPAMLVEMGFLSNPADEAALGQPAHRERIAAALSRTVLAWLLRQEQLAGGGGFG
ncbi:N-acetylmuramoyl-L-alanine amidase [Roseomonas sp. NAR14]|uniref:N-acetylmuramoyl-L-alanine amidase n=1 Tax=Roseomonas acroporae TaxID=2937791 RepID=A0A9X2BTS5_9PROT|nr:N-acetylmuramoyl-L-alanine amidase [Roseomonas acroporae]MCK8784933.1 N-acetylmuramoyl-L-alanine amidase [Roseomonas acroporae]